MKTANTKKLEEVSNDIYIKFLEMAEMYQEKGFFPDKSVIELAEMLYNRSDR